MPTRFVTITGLMTWEEEGGGPGPQPPLHPGWPTVPGWPGGSLPGGPGGFPMPGWPTVPGWPGGSLPGGPGGFPGGGPPLVIWGPNDPRPTLPIAGWNPATGGWPERPGGGGGGGIELPPPPEHGQGGGPSQPIAGQPGPGGVLVFYYSPIYGWVAVPASGDWGNIHPGAPTTPPEGGTTPPPEGGTTPPPEGTTPPPAGGAAARESKK